MFPIFAVLLTDTLVCLAACIGQLWNSSLAWTQTNIYLSRFTFMERMEAQQFVNREVVAKVFEKLLCTTFRISILYSIIIGHPSWMYLPIACRFPTITTLLTCFVFKQLETYIQYVLRKVMQTPKQSFTPYWQTFAEIIVLWYMFQIYRNSHPFNSFIGTILFVCMFYFGTSFIVRLQCTIIPKTLTIRSPSASYLTAISKLAKATGQPTNHIFIADIQSDADFMFIKLLFGDICVIPYSLFSSVTREQVLATICNTFAEKQSESPILRTYFQYIQLVFIWIVTFFLLPIIPQIGCGTFPAFEKNTQEIETNLQYALQFFSFYLASLSMLTLLSVFERAYLKYPAQKKIDTMVRKQGFGPFVDADIQKQIIEEVKEVGCYLSPLYSWYCFLSPPSLFRR